MAAGQAIDVHDQINTTGFYVQLGTAQVSTCVTINFNKKQSYSFPQVRSVGLVCDMGGPERLRPVETVSLPPAGESEGVDVARTAAADQRERRQLAGQLARTRLGCAPATPAGQV